MKDYYAVPPPSIFHRGSPARSPTVKGPNAIKPVRRIRNRSGKQPCPDMPQHQYHAGRCCLASEYLYLLRKTLFFLVRVRIPTHFYISSLHHRFESMVYTINVLFPWISPVFQIPFFTIRTKRQKSSLCLQSNSSFQNINPVSSLHNDVHCITFFFQFDNISFIKAPLLKRLLCLFLRSVITIPQHLYCSSE